MKVVLADLRQDHIDEALAAFGKRGQLENVHAGASRGTDRRDARETAPGARRDTSGATAGRRQQ
jgi:hypothetical protein